MTIRLMFVHYTSSSVWVTEWPSFEKYLPTRLAICFHCILVYFVFFNYYHFGFKSEMWLLMAPVSVDCFSSTYIIHSL